MKKKIVKPAYNFKYNYTYILLFSFLYLNILFIKANNIQNNHYHTIFRKISEQDSDNIINKNEMVKLGDKDYKYITNTVNEDGELFIESSSLKEVTQRYVTGLYSNGRNYFAGSNIKIYSFDKKIRRRTGNSIVIKSNNKKYLLNICYDDDGYFEFLDLLSLDSPNNIYKKSDDIVDKTIASNINSLFKLRNEDCFIFAYFTQSGTPGFYKQHLIIIKGIITIESNSFSYNTIVKKDNIKTAFSNTLSCFETTLYINCFYLNLNEQLTITIFNKNLDFLYETLLEKSSEIYPKNYFRKGIFLKNEISTYIYFIEDATRPKLAIKNFIYDTENGYSLNNLLKNINIVKLDGEEELNNNCDTSDILKINENRFTFISTISETKDILILLFDLYNEDKSLSVRKYIFDLEAYKMNTNLRLFLFRNFIGFSYCYGDNECCSYRILNYGKTIDYEKVDDFLNKIGLINPLNLISNIYIDNNIFGYKFIGTKIISIPDKELTGLLITKNKEKKEILENDILINEEIIFSYISNTIITEGDYILEFAAIVGEIDYETFNSKITSTITYGEQKNQEPFFSPLNYTGRYGHFIFNIRNNDDLKCYENCHSCYKKGESENEQNCITCIDDYFFVENTKNCFKDPIGYYLNENQLYSSCHPLCKYCISKEKNDTYMNCLSCRESDYKFYRKNRNCLKCQKYVNYEQTECINEIPKGYYLSNISYGIIEKCNEYCSICSKGPTYNSMNCDACIEGHYLLVDDINIKNCFSNEKKIPSNYYKRNEPNIYYKCFELCGSCDKEGNSLNMNCLTCVNNITYEYDPDNKNCFPRSYCKYNYYYEFNENKMKSKICLSENAICPESFPYEIIATKECVLYCSLENLINSICKLSNQDINIEKFTDYFRKEIENNDELINNIINENFKDLALFGNNIIYQLSTTINQEFRIESKINDGISSIDLGDCESIIKKENNIDEKVSLIILKYDIKTKESLATQVKYDVYNPITKKKLNLDSCKNTSITIYSPVDLNDNLFEIYKYTNEQGYDIFDPENIFYKDVCTPYTTINGTDIILTDRINDILNNTGPLCEDICDYEGFDIETKKVICECDVKINDNSTESSNENFQLKKFEKIYTDLKKQLNYKVLKCHKLLLDYKNIISNYGFYILTIIIIMFFILITINFFTSIPNLKTICSKIIEERKKFINSYSKQSSLNIINKRYSQNIQSNNKLEEPPKKVIQKSQTNNVFVIIKPTKRKSALIHSDSTSRKRINNENIKGIKNLDNNKDNKIVKNIKTKNKKEKSRQSKSSRFSILLNNSNSKINLTKRKTLASNLEIYKKIKEKNNFLDEYIMKLSKDDIDKLFYEEELNLMEYKYAIKLDKRDLITYYFSLIKQKQLLIFTFLVNNDYNIYLMKVSFFLCSFILYLMTNTFFFNDDNMHKIYVDKGQYNFFYQIPQILYSSIISSVITVILKYLSLSQKSVIKIKQINEFNDMVQKYFLLLKNFKFKLIIFNLLGLAVLFFNWYYITLFCAVYANTQSHLLTDTFTSFGLSLVYPFILSLFPGLLRIPALKSEKKDRKVLYQISQLIAFI